MRTKMEDNTNEVIKAISKYDIVLEIVANTAEKIIAVSETLTSPRTSNLDGMPHQPNPRAGESRLAAGIDLIASMEERYREAQIFIMWFEPMWKALSEEEREILKTYKCSDRYNGEMERYASEHGVCVRQAHRNRKKALEHLQALLFGCL